MSWSPVGEAELGMVLFLPEKPVLLFAQTQTKLILVTARGETSEADLIPIKLALFFQPQWELENKGDAAPSSDSSGQQFHCSALEP